MGAPADVASVARQLLAFYREPALRRPPYLHGEAPLPDGQVVFRLALGRFPEGWLRELPASERDEVREAARAFVRQVCLWERATHYQVLCLAPGASREAIRESYHLLIALIHPDRQEGSPGWPTGCAQRANQAHAALADPQARSGYDEQLRRAGEGSALEAAMRMAQAADAGAGRRRSRSRASPSSLLRRFAVVGGVVVALFIVQAWWVGDVAPQHSLLERAAPASARWMRDMLPDPPRFLATPAVAAAFDPGARLEPLKEPRRMAALGSWIPVQERALVPEPAAPVAQLPAAAAAPTAIAAPMPAVVSPAVEPRLRLAQLVPAPPRVAQAPAAPAAAGPTREQVEILVAAIVGYYDAGDADRLVGLFDPAQLGWFSGPRLRETFADFFATTRERRLRMDRLTWQASGGSALALGEATVVADYHDGRPRLERRAPIEVDIGLRDGEARITRLVLYPHGGK